MLSKELTDEDEEISGAELASTASEEVLAAIVKQSQKLCIVIAEDELYPAQQVIGCFDESFKSKLLGSGSTRNVLAPHDKFIQEFASVGLVIAVIHLSSSGDIVQFQLIGQVDGHGDSCLEELIVDSDWVCVVLQQKERHSPRQL